MMNYFFQKRFQVAGAVGFALLGLLLAGSSVAVAQGAQPYPGAPPQGYAYPPQSYAPPPGYAYAAPAYPGYQTHDGFFMRLALGGGYAHSSVSSPGYDLTLSGGSVAMDFAFGGAVAPNLILFGEIAGHAVPSPSWKENSYLGYTSGTAKDNTLNVIGVGPGITYYIMPQNMYLSGSVLLHFLTMSAKHSDVTADLSDAGVAVNLMVGKEWWVSADWGLGIAGQFIFGSAKAKNTDARFATVGAGVLFSATYN